MKVTLNSISGIPDAIATMFISKRTWTPELDSEIRRVCGMCLNYKGFFDHDRYINGQDANKFEDWMNKLTAWGWQHITLLRFIDFSFTVEGLHRAGQDDWDSHAKRFDNRIIRSSTRLAKFGNEKSDWYKDKVLSTDEALSLLGQELPDTITKNGSTYVRTVNGYVREDFKDSQDAKRGLYMLDIPSNFIYKINLCEWGHVYKERNVGGGANPEVKQCCELSVDLIEGAHKQFNRELFLKIKN
jgi:hypothetical protein